MPQRILARYLILLPAILATLGAAAPTSPKVDAFETRLDRAKAAFLASIEQARKKLDTEFEAVVKDYTKDGNLDRALAVRQERERFVGATTLPSIDSRIQIADGWTILFRSADPLVWNIEVQNADSYAIPVRLAPAGAKYLRIRRMDSGDYVIMEGNLSNSPPDKTPPVRPWFRGDKRLDKGGCLLGIVDYRHPAEPTQPFIRYAGPYSGWGFAIPANTDGQAWVWDSKTINPTSFEIATTTRNLSSEETKHLIP